jgi:hypothetical protein
MPKHPFFDRLVERELITRAVADKAAQVPLYTASSAVARLVAVGEDRTRILRAVAELASIPVATRTQIASSAPVKLSQTVARALRTLTACPVQQAPDGTLHVLIADPDAQPEVERLLPGCVVYLAHEDEVRDLLVDLYPSGSSIADGPPVGAIDIDMEASAQFQAAPRPTTPAPAASPPPRPRPPAPAPAAAPADPLAPRPSGPHKIKRFTAEEETQRIERAPRAPRGPADIGGGDETVDEASLPRAQLAAAADPARAAFWRGVAVGAGATAVVAALVIAALLLR